MSILGMLLLGAAVMAYVSYPLWNSEPTPRASGRKSKARAGLEPKSAPAPAPVSDVDELELDRQIGRLDEQEYAALQNMPAAVVGPGREQDQQDKEDDDIERRVRALRQERARRAPNKRQEH